MLFHVLVETPKSEDESFGIYVPAFSRLDYGCYSAADTEEEIVSQAQDAILGMSEEVLADGYDLNDLKSNSVFSLSADSEHSDFDYQLVLDVDLSELKGKQVRVNISMADTLLARIERAVQSGQYKDRSNFLETAARHELSH